MKCQSLLTEDLARGHDAVTVGSQEIQGPEVLVPFRRVLIDVDRVQLSIIGIFPDGS
jgi:hypothetical protein